MNKKNKLIFGMVLIAVTVLLVSVGSATYTRSVPQGVIPGLNVGSSGNLVGSDFSRELCNEAGQDFIIQIAPAGCESVPVRSDLLEENNVQVFCQLSATNLNPLIKVEAIEGITFSGDFPPEVTSVNFHPAKAALGIRGDLNSPIMENIGYVVINLRRQPNESAMPDFVEGNLTARIRYDIKEAFGVGDASFYLPEISSNEWNNKYKQYGFWDSRGYLRAEAIGNGEATVSIYSGSNNRLSGITLKDGETSNKLYLPGMGLCTANFQVKLKDIEAPDTRARLKINAEIVEVAEGARFLDNKCKVLDITKHGIIQRTELQCEEDNGDRENFNLIISPKVKLKIDGEIKVVGVGDRLPFSNDPSKSVFLGYVGIEDDSKNEEKLYFRLIQTPYHGGKLSEDMLNEVERFDTQSWKSQSGGSIRKSIAFAASETVTWLERFTKYLVVGTEISNVVKYEDGSESVYGSDVSILGFAEPTDEEFSNDKELQEIYSKSLADYNTVLGSYSGEKVLESEVELGEQAAYEKIRLLSFFNQKRASVELCEEFKLDYPSSNKDLEAYCNDKLTIANSDINNRQVLINGELKDITLTAVYEPSLDDYGVSITINNAGDYSGIFEMRKKERVAFSETEFIMLEELTTEYAKFDVSSVKESSGKEFFWKTNQLTIGLNDFQVVGQEEYRITLNQINLENVARVEVISNIDNVGSESSFKFKIGIEKRAIQLSPEKINSKIRKLEHNMKKLEGITNNLGEVVEAGKTACLVTGAALTFKNLVFNLKGKGIARQKVMRSTGGWYEICNNQVNSELSSSQEKCLLDNSETIESDVSAMEVKMSAMNERIKIIKDANDIDLGLFQTGFNQSGIMQTYSQKIESKLQGMNSFGISGEDNISMSELRTSLNYNVWKDSKNYDIEQLKDIELYLDIANDGSISQEMRDAANKRLYSVFSDIEVSTGSSATRTNVANNLGISFSSITFLKLQDNIKEIPYKGLTNGNLGSGKLSSVENDAPVEVIQGSNGQIYFIVLDDSFGTQELSIKEVGGSKQIFNSSGLVPASDIPEVLNRVYFKKYDTSAYENEFKNPKVSYYESEPYKGFPAVVPFDIENGWYAAIKSTLPVFGNLASYDASGRANSFYLCNVGKNGEQEFFSGIGDDDCEMMNLGTGQPLNQFYGVDENKARKLVDDAVSAIEQASNQYKNGIRTVSIFRRNIPVGEPAVETPDLQCQDFMSPQDCNIMFNVCDPFICPNSRCDFGGKYPVRDVIQSGVIGSTLLCLPNYNEGIVVPVCLSGIHAGIDGWNQIQTSYRDCLQTSLETGQTVGICDEIHSIYGCEFFWRQAAPLAKVAVPRTIGGVLGQNSRGGGEYLGVKDAWSRAGDSVDYFKQFYAKNAVDAFDARTTEDVGSTVCKVSVSAVLPKGGSIIDALTKPDSPHQVNGRFDEIPYTTATNPPVSQYKVFFNIYAGSDAGAYYSVYLRPGSSSYYQDTNLIQTVDSGYIAIGEYKTETIDELFPSGYKELCINVNGQEYCGFKEVSTSFAVDYVKDQYLVEQASQTNIVSEKECIAGTPSDFSLLNPNLQEGVGDYIDSSIYNKNIIRTCATKNPGVGADLSSVTAEARWKQVGYCGDQKIKCWLDTKSVEDAIKFDINDDLALEDVSKTYVDILMSEGNYTNDADFNSAIAKIELEVDSNKKISLIDEIITKVFHNYQKGNLYYLRGNAYRDLALWVGHLTADGGVDLPSFEFQDGTGDANLYYLYYNNKWQVSSDERNWKDVSNNVVFEESRGNVDRGTNYVEEIKLSDKNQEFVSKLINKDYATGLSLLIDRTLANDEAQGFIGAVSSFFGGNTGLSANKVIMNNEGVFKLSKDSHLLPISNSYWKVEVYYLKYENNQWIGSYDQNNWNAEEALRNKNFYEGAFIILVGEEILPAQIGAPVVVPVVVPVPAVLSCQESLGNQIMNIAKEIKTKYAFIDDNLVKQETGAESFECLVLQIAMHESGIQHCEQEVNGDCLYCDKDSDLSKLKHGGGEDYGLMQINIGVHSSMQNTVSDFNKHVKYAVEEVLIKGHRDTSKEYACKSTSYQGWERALRSYNGWNTDCSKGDINYVKNVENRKSFVGNLFSECS